MKIADIGLWVLVLLVTFTLAVDIETAMAHIAAVAMTRMKYMHKYSHSNERDIGISD